MVTTAEVSGCCDGTCGGSGRHFWTDVAHLPSGGRASNCVETSGEYMRCYECSQAGETTDVIGLCHHCSVALCTEHARMIQDPVLGHAPMFKEFALPKSARMLLCSTCNAAIMQPNLG